MSGRFAFLLMVIVALSLSWVPFIHWPFQWLQTYYHEISHGLAALATGGQISRIELNADGSGVCYTRGGSRFIISLFGYIGAVFWGMLIYLSTTIRSAKAFQGIILITAVLLIITLGGWSRDVATVAILTVLLALVILHWRLKSIFVTRLFFQFIGIYILLDAIKSPLHLIDGLDKGDGAILSNISGIPEIAWVVCWFGIALIGLYICWKHSKKFTRDSISNRTI